MKTFQFNGHTYTRIYPSPAMYHSNMVRDVTNRGSIFALNVENGVFTVLPGNAQVDVTPVVLHKKRNSEPTTQLTLALTSP